MGIKQILELLLICLLLLIGAAYMEYSNQLIDDSGQIQRNPFGKGKKDAELLLNVDNELENYHYLLTIEEQKVTKEQAQQYFAQAKREIDETFANSNETLDHITQSVSMKDSYVDGNVQAQWFFDQYKYIDEDGSIIEAEITEAGELVSVEVTLTCGTYQEIYAFAFMIYPRELSGVEKLVKEIDQAIGEQQEKEGIAYIQLPTEIEGASLEWSEVSEHLVLKVLLLEAIIIIMLPLVMSSRKKQEIKKKQDILLLAYPEMVSKLNVLVGAGMTIKQAWHIISAQYVDKKQKCAHEESPVYEEMVKTDREIRDGASERLAYQQFGERIGIATYHRFARILVQNLQKGNCGMCEILNQETENAYANRKAMAKKLGEEAGTKLLFPMILMLGIVMAIVMVPALFGFSM